MRGVMLFAAAVVAVVAARTPADDEPKKADKPAKVETLELGDLKGKVPAGWKKEKPTSSMRKAQFKAAKAEKDKEDAEFSVFEFKAAGTVKANFDRQLAAFYPEGRTAKESKAKVGPFEADVQDVAGTFRKKKAPMDPDDTPMKDYRQLYVVFEDKEKVQYYLKFLGPKATVEKHKKAFDEFLASFK